MKDTRYKIQDTYNSLIGGVGLGIVSAALLISPALSATIFYETGFETGEGFTPGAVAGQGTTSWSSSSTSGEIVTAIGGVSAPQGGQMLSIQRPSGSDNRDAGVNFLGFQAGPTEDIRFSFLISADTKTNAAIGISIGSSSMSSSGAWFGLRSPSGSGTTGDFSFYYREGSTSTYNVIDSDAKLTIGEFVRVEMDVFWNNGNSTFNLTIWDLDEFGDNNSMLAQKNGIEAHYRGAGNSAPMDNFNRIFMDIDQVGDTNFLFDDFRVESIPESSISLLSILAALPLLLTRRRK